MILAAGNRILDHPSWSPDGKKIEGF